MSHAKSPTTPRACPRPALSVMATAFAALCLLAAPSWASTFELDLHSYDGANLICGGSLDQQTDSAPVSSSVSEQINDIVSNSAGTYEAIADPGMVGMRMAVSHRVSLGFNRLFGSCSEVFELIDDIVVSGPPGMITADLNADLIGTLEVDSLALAQIRVTVGLKVLPGGGGVGDESSTVILVDVSESADISQAVSSGPVTFQVGDELIAELRIEMSLVSGGLPGGETSVNKFDLMDEASGFGLHFSESNVLTLPAGYTSSSVDGDIGDNMWQGTVPVVQHTWGQLKSMYR